MQPQITTHNLKIMASEGETKLGSEDYYLDIVLTLGLLVAIDVLIEIFKGCSRKWGERIH